MKIKNSLPLIFLTILSTIFIFYRFVDLPKNLAFDEVEFTKLALSLDGKPYSPYSQLATGHSTLYFYILLASLKTFGINTFALRLPSAVFGILSVIMFYFIIRLSFRNSPITYLLSLVFLSSRWLINFSRFSFEPTFLLFLELTSIYCFLKAKTPFRVKFLNNLFYEKTVSGIFLILSGLFAGLAFNSYTPGRIFFLLPLIFIILYKMKSLNDKIKNILLFLTPFLIVITPLIISLSSIKDTRIDQLFFWRNHEMTIRQKVTGTVQNTISLTSMFFYKGDMNGRHNYPGKPALNPILLGLFVFGLFRSIKNYKNKLNIFFIFYFIISMAPSIPIYPWENPSMLRTFTVIPSVVYFIGQGIITLRESRFFIKRKMTIIIILILFSSLYELRTYFKYQAKVFESSFEITHSLEKAIKMENPYEKKQ